MEAPSNATAHAKIMKMRQKIGVQKRVKKVRRGIGLLRPEPTQVEPDLKNSEQAAALLFALNGLGSEGTLSLSTLLLLARSTPAMYFLPAASSSSMPVLVVGRGPLGPL